MLDKRYIPLVHTLPAFVVGLVFKSLDDDKATWFAGIDHLRVRIVWALGMVKRVAHVNDVERVQVWQCFSGVRQWRVNLMVLVVEYLGVLFSQQIGSNQFGVIA